MKTFLTTVAISVYGDVREDWENLVQSELSGKYKTRGELFRALLENYKTINKKAG